MPLMDYFNAGGNPMAAIVKQIQGALNSIGGKIDTPKGSGMLGNFGATDAQNYVPPMNPDPVKTNLTESGWGYPGPYGTMEKALPPKTRSREPGVGGRGRHGIFEPPKHTQDITNILDLPASRSFKKDIQGRISDAADLRAGHGEDEQRRYKEIIRQNQPLLPESLHTIGDQLARLYITTAIGRGDQLTGGELPIVARHTGPQEFYEFIPPGLRPMTKEFDYKGDDPWALEHIERELNERDMRPYTESEGMRIWDVLRRQKLGGVITR